MSNPANENLLKSYEELNKEYEEETTKLSQVINLLKKMVNLVENGSQEKNPSEITKKLNLLKELVWLEQLKQFDETREAAKKYDSPEEWEIEIELHEDYEQMVLPGCSPEERTVHRVKRKVNLRMFRRERTFVKTAATRQMAEILQDLDHKWLSDYHRYLCTDIGKKSGKRMMAEKLVEWIYEYPLQLSLALDESSIRLLNKISDLKDNEKLTVNEKNIDDYLQLANLGIIDLEVIWEKEQLYFGISVPDEVKEKILPAWKEIRQENLVHDSLDVYLTQGEKRKAYSIKELQRELDLFFDRILLMVYFYGLVEAKELWRIFGEVYQADISLKELMRFIYLKGTLHQTILTANNRITGETFVGIPESNVDEIILKREKYCKDIEYPVVTEDKMEETLWGVDAMWREVCGYLEGRESQDGELDELFEIGKEMVTSGCSVAEVMEYLLEWYKVENPVRRGTLWRLLLLISFATPLPMLKGYSRDAFNDEYGKYLYLDMFQASGKKIRKASLYELPVEIQEKLAELILVSERESYFDLISREEELPKECMQNEEIKLLLLMNRAVTYRKIHDPVLKEGEKKKIRDMAFDLCEECRDSETKDLILKTCNNLGIVNYVSEGGRPWMGRGTSEDVFEDDDWGDDYALPQPVVKPAKIYPNAPCPCGSGKKYKKCCGRKAETK